MNPLAWIFATSASAAILSYKYEAPNWLGIMFGVLAGLSMAIYLYTYLRFSFNNIEALRSEKYVIQMAALNKGLIGDDLTGYQKVNEPLAIESSSRNSKKDQQ